MGGEAGAEGSRLWEGGIDVLGVAKGLGRGESGQVPVSTDCRRMSCDVESENVFSVCGFCGKDGSVSLDVVERRSADMLETRTNEPSDDQTDDRGVFTAL